MILSLSTATHLYWLGRYMVRVEGICQLAPFQNDQKAMQFAHAFCLPAWNVESLERLLHDPVQPSSLPSNLAVIQENAQSVRGVISQATFEALNTLWRMRDHPEVSTCQLLAQAKAAFAHEQGLVQTFWSLGQAIEAVDMSLRLEDSPQPALAILKTVQPCLPETWQRPKRLIDSVLSYPSASSFYSLTDGLSEMFAEGP